ncbi:MAG: hypothetical protein QN183_16230 [Armatimonadota bacterium]|nr:hypothetical protein [Armatimonadota bacterium]MDR7543991.1 hypothetical protein [Armatimonadota bacterium]
MKRKPLQIYLEERQDRALREIARRRNVSLARLLREGADRIIEEALPPQADPLMELPELAAPGGPPDGADHHDAYLVPPQRRRQSRR